MMVHPRQVNAARQIGILLGDRELIAAANAGSPALESRLQFALRKACGTDYDANRLMALCRLFYRPTEETTDETD